MANDTKQLKRTHKKPYKVGALYFGRSSTRADATWIVSKSEDLSNPLREFEIGKEARSYCEEQRDANRPLRKPKQTLAAEPTTGDESGGEQQPDINIPSDTGLSNILSADSEDKLV